MTKKYTAVVIREMNASKATEVTAYADTVEEAVQQIKDRYGPLRTWWKAPTCEEDQVQGEE